MSVSKMMLPEEDYILIKLVTGKKDRRSEAYFKNLFGKIAKEAVL